jgi:hypothetical protein
MRVFRSIYRSRGDVEPMAGLAVKLLNLSAEVRACARPDCAALPDGVARPDCVAPPGYADVPPAPIGARR